MLVLSKLTNINHANGGSYDPPLFLYSALFAARGRFGGASPHGGALAGLPRTAFFAGVVHSALGGQLFSPFFAYAPGTRQKHPQNFAGYIAVFHIA